MKKIFQNQFYQGSIIVTLFGFMAGIINYCFTFLAARILGPSGYGEITALFSYIAICTIPVSIFNLYLLQKISSTTSKRVLYAKSIEVFFWNKIKKWWFLIIPVVVCIPFISKFTNLSTITAISLVPFIIISFFSSVYLTSNQGLRLFLAVSIISIIAVLIKVIGPILATLGIDGFTIVILFIFLSTLFLFIGQYFVFRKNTKGIHAKKIIKIEKRILHIISSTYFLSIAFSTFASIIIINFDIVFVKKFFLSSEAGIYSLWSVCSKILYYVLGPIIAISFIFFANVKNKKEVKHVFIVSFLLIIMGAIFNYLIYFLYGNEFINIFFGNKYLQVIKYLPKASIFAFFYTLMLFLNTYFLANKRKITFLLPAALIIYIPTLFLFGTKLESVMNINIGFTGIVSCMYLIYFFIHNPLNLKSS